MKSKRSIIAISTASLVILATSFTVFAATTGSTSANALAEITGRTIESIVAEKSETGITYGAIAAEADKLDEFKAASLEAKKEILDARVSAGTMTQDDADAIITAIEENQIDCNGTQSYGVGKATGARFTSMSAGQGAGGTYCGTETGKSGNIGRRGMGGFGLQDGSCYTVE